MHNRYGISSILLTIAFEIILTVTAALNIMSRNWKTVKLAASALVVLLLPFVFKFIADRKKILLPSYFRLFSVLFIFSALFLGEINNFYDKYWWYDLLLHGTFGIFIVITFIHMVQGTIAKEKKVTDRRFVFAVCFFAFCFSMALGTLWELFEFGSDYIFRAGMVKGGIEDSMTDLLIKAVCSAVTVFIYYLRNRNDLSKLP
jgi:hypothetical protein